MARSHEPNNFENHWHIMQSAVANYEFALDDSFLEVVPYNSNELIEGNRLYLQEINNESAAVYGEFRMIRQDDESPWVRISVTKHLKIIIDSGHRKSFTEKYRYQIWLTRDPQGSQASTRVIRFDNGDTHEGHDTSNHLHIQVDSKRKKLKRWSHPAHVALNFPYLADVLRIGHILTFHNGGASRLHAHLLEKFQGLSKSVKNSPSDWPLKFEKDLFYFVIP